MWYTIDFDNNFVTCSGCGEKYNRAFASTKRKCPQCKIDNQKCYPDSRALSAARQRKRRKQWADALHAAGWTESQFVTAVISGKVTLPAKQ